MRKKESVESYQEMLHKCLHMFAYANVHLYQLDAGRQQGLISSSLLRQMLAGLAVCCRRWQSKCISHCTANLFLRDTEICTSTSFKIIVSNHAQRIHSNTTTSTIKTEEAPPSACAFHLLSRTQPSVFDDNNLFTRHKPQLRVFFPNDHSLLQTSRTRCFTSSYNKDSYLCSNQNTKQVRVVKYSAHFPVLGATTAVFIVP